MRRLIASLAFALALWATPANAQTQFVERHPEHPDVDEIRQGFLEDVKRRGKAPEGCSLKQVDLVAPDGSKSDPEDVLIMAECAHAKHRCFYIVNPEQKAVNLLTCETKPVKS